MDDETQKRCERRDNLVRRMCAVMEWPLEEKLLFLGIIKIAHVEAVPVSLEKLQEVLDKLEGFKILADERDEYKRRADKWERLHDARTEQLKMERRDT